MFQNKEILLSLVGKSPQVVTEALYCLLIKKKIHIDEIVVITTEDCAEEVFTSLNREISNFCRRFRIKNLQFERGNIIKAQEEIVEQTKISSMTETIFETIKNSKQEGNALHCFISGGRKTMSVDLAIALSIFGDDNDRMYHVIASPEFAETKKFYPETEEEAKMLYLVEKPFVKLKYKDAADTQQREISKLVEKVQERIDSSVSLPDLTIRISERLIRIGEVDCYFQPLVFAVYLFFAKQEKFVRGGKNFSKTHSEALWKLYQKISPSYGHRDRVAKAGLEEGKIDFEVVQKAISIIRNKISELLEGQNIAEFYTISQEGTYADKKYGIRLPKSKIRILK